MKKIGYVEWFRLFLPHFHIKPRFRTKMNQNQPQNQNKKALYKRIAALIEDDNIHRGATSG